MQVTVNAHKYNGAIRRSWSAELVHNSDSSIIVKGVFGLDVSHERLGLIRRGTISVEYFPLDKWFNVFRFYEPNGSFRNLYCNINMPPTFADGVLDYVDLDIDVVVWPDARVDVLDLDEFRQNADLLGYPETLIKNAEDSLAALLEMIDQREFPFGCSTDHLGWIRSM